MGMKGFDSKFRDVPDYIEGITHEIWEQRGVGVALKKYYADGVLVRAANAMIEGNDGVTATTLQTLHEFPDRQLIGEDVIWCNADPRGYLSSHRLCSVMRHTGSGTYGSATGRAVRARTIAECWIYDNQVHEEWLVRDQAAIANCLGMSPRALARQQVEREIDATGEVTVFTPESDVAGTLQPKIESGADADRYADAWSAIWGDKHLAIIPAAYRTGANVFIPGGGVAIGHGDIDRFVNGYLASFPDARFRVEQLTLNADEGRPMRLAMRWSISATHSGWGVFGAPTGAPVYLMGLTHAHIVNGKIETEWVLIDEVSVWKQILRDRRLE